MTDTIAPAAEGAAPAPIAAGATPPMRRRAGVTRLSVWLPPLAVFAALIGVWFLISTALGDKAYLMPLPQTVLEKGFLTPATFGDIMEATGLSATVALTGLAIAIVIGVLWAIAMSQAKWVERSLYPYAVILQCIPILALVPLIGFWFGYDFFARTVVCVLIALFPMVSNTLFGLQSVDRGHRELFKLQGASRWTILTKLELPAATPAIFAGMRISAGLSVVGAIVGDFFFQRGTPGIGALISRYGARLNSAELFASILVASLFGVVIFLLFGWLGRRAVGKWYDFG
jgi:NitT/TauT family transport system permease protein